MDHATIAGLATAGMLVLLALGVPVAVCLGLPGIIGLSFIGGWKFALVQLESLPYQLTSSYSFSVLPMFLFMGNLAMNGGMARELYTAADRLIGHFRGGLLHGFGFASGLSTTGMPKAEIPLALKSPRPRTPESHLISW